MNNCSDMTFSRAASGLYLPAVPEILPLVEADSALLRLRPSPLRDVVHSLPVPSGLNLLFGLRQACRDSGLSVSVLRHASVYINGTPVPRQAWATRILGKGEYVSICVPLAGGGGGGKNPLATVLQLVVVAVAAVATWYVGGAGGALVAAGWTASAASVAGAVVGMGIMMAGSLLVNAIAPASQPKLTSGDSEQAARIWSIDGTRNRADLYGPVPVVLGRVRWAPRLAAKSYSVLSGNDQYVRYLYAVGMGDVLVEEPRVGTTDFANFAGSNYIVHRNWQGEPLTYFDKNVSEESFSIALKASSGRVTRTTARDTTRVQVFLAFPRGMKGLWNDGGTFGVSVSFRVEYRAVGTTAWRGYGGTRTTAGGSVNALPEGGIFWGTASFTVGVDANGSVLLNAGWPVASGTLHRKNDSEELEYYVTVSPAGGFTGSITTSGTYVVIGAGHVEMADVTYSAETVTAQRRGLMFDLPAGQYEIGVTRLSGDHDQNATDPTILDESVWTGMQSWSDKPSIVYRNRPLTLIEAQLKATDQLSGTVDEFNVLCTSVAPVWTGEAWEDRPTNNPASLGFLLLTGRCTGKSAEWAEMDLPRWAAFYEWCANERFGWAYNAVQTSRTMDGELLHNVLAAGRGSYANRGAHSVIWDDPEEPVAELLTPRNTWGFQAVKEFLDEPIHGLRMRFLNEEKDFQEDERVVYTDGFDESNATNIIEWEQDGVTNPNLIYKHGRLRLAELRLRPEVYTLSAEAESLTLLRGNRTRSQHDVTLWGVTSGRVMRQIPAPEEDGAGREPRVIGIEIDEEVGMDAGKNYGIRVSSPASPDTYYALRTRPGEVGRELYFERPIPAAGAPGFDDLVAFGIAGRETTLLTVLSVTPGDNYTAQLTLCDAAPNVYDAIDGPIPEWDSNITDPSRYQSGKPAKPQIVSVISDESVLIKLPNGSTMPRIAVNFYVPDRASVIVDTVTLFLREHDGGEPWRAVASVRPDAGVVYAQDVNELVAYDVRLMAVSRLGVGSDYSAVAVHTVIGRTTPPPAPDGLWLNGYEIQIQQTRRPLDVTGHEVWMAFDEDDDFGMALRLSNPITTSGRFDLTPWAGRARRVFVRTVDELGLLSDVVSVAINLGDVLPTNVIFAISERERGWPGGIERGYVDGRALYADSGVHLWQQDDELSLWPQDDALPLWPSGSGAILRYTYRIDIPAAYAGARVFVQPDIIAGRLRAIEYRVYHEAALWPQDNDAPLWQQDDTAHLWAQPVAGDWLPLPDNYVSPGGQTIELRITLSDAEAGHLADIRTLLDVQDKEWAIQDLYIPVGGVHLPLPPHTFRGVTNVTFGLQYVDESVARSVQRFPRTEKIGDDGYLIAGPLIAGFDSAGRQTWANTDIRILGY